MAIDLVNMTGLQFERLVAQLLTKIGLSVTSTKESGDGGIDLVAVSDQPFFEGKYIIQCKRWTGSVGEPIVRDLYGVVMSERANKGILVTTGSFTGQAEKFASHKPLELIEGGKLLGNRSVGV
jgi:restriction system protein